MSKTAPCFCASEDLDRARCRAQVPAAVEEDLEWFGLRWQEEPVRQSERRAPAWKGLRDRGLVYPCHCSRRDVLSAAGAPHAEDEEPIYPGACRPLSLTISRADDPAGVNWRFRVPDGETLSFVDQSAGAQSAFGGVDFGDFVI